MDEDTPLPQPDETAAVFPGGWPQQLWFFFCAVVLPIASFALAFTGFAAPEWQSGQLSDWAKLLLDRPGAAAFAPLAAAAVGLAAAVAIRPGRWVRSAWARIGLLLALVLALQYSMLIPAAFVLKSSWAELPTSFWQWLLIPLYLGGAITTSRLAVIVYRWPSRLPIGLPALGPAFVSLFAYAAVILVLLLFSLFSLEDFVAGLSSLTTGLILALMILVILVAAPVWTAETVGRLLLRLGRPEKWPAAGLLAMLAAYLISWRLAITRAIEAYQALPTEYSGCFVATAAAQAPPWLTGSFELSGRFRVSPQLQRFKLFELALRELFPGFHRKLRKIYDTIGPRLAARISPPGRAGLAWLALRPAELLAAALLRLFAGREISRRAASLYRR